MLRTTAHARTIGVCVAALAITLGGAAQSARAAAVIAWAYDPTPTKVYFQFSTDVAFDAYRAKAYPGFLTAATRPGPGVPPAGAAGGNPPMPVTGASNDITLPPGNYTLFLDIQFTPGVWSLNKKVQTFTIP